MAVLSRFRRQKSVVPDMPPEVQDYYQAESRGRSGLAWLLALGTLLVTVLVVFGLFFGGRFIFRKLRHTGKPTPVAVQTQKSPQQGIAPPRTSNPTPPTTSNPGSTTPTTPPTGSSSSPATGTSSTSTNTPSASSSSGSAAASGSSSTNPSQSNPSDIPKTGPGGTLAVFLAVSLAAYVLHRRFSAARSE